MNPTPYAGLGKLPPQATDLEEALLGALMLGTNKIHEVSQIITVESFYRDNHKKIYNAIMALYEKSNPIDILTVTNQLRIFGELEMIGGSYYLVELAEKNVSSASIEYHARIIEQKYMAREIIRTSTEYINAAYEDTIDILELVEKVQSETLSLNSKKHARQATFVKDVITELREDYKQPVINGLTGISSGLSSVDAISHGWQDGHLIIVAARPAMGKTAFALKCASFPSVNQNKPVAVFSLEMSSKQLTNRLISNQTDTYQNNILTRNLNAGDFLRIESKIGALESAPLIIDDTPSLNIFEFRSKCRRLKSQHDIRLIVIDYLQLMEGKKDAKGNTGLREQEISSISRCLKSVAKELNVPVIALSQLSRGVDARPNKRPLLSDLRESGSIEQDADSVLFLYRPEYYGITKDPITHESNVGLVEVIFAKNRDGVTETAKVDFNGAFMRFSDRKTVSDVVTTDGKQLSVINYSNIEDDSDPF
jgi:replicative DNA helicase